MNTCQVKSIQTASIDCTQYPKHVEYGKQRKFQGSWLKAYPWLVYSKKLDGGLCLACVLFSKRRPDRIHVGKAMTKYNKATDYLKDHNKSQSHKNAMQGLPLLWNKNSYQLMS